MKTITVQLVLLWDERPRLLTLQHTVEAPLVSLLAQVSDALGTQLNPGKWQLAYQDVVLKWAQTLSAALPETLSPDTTQIELQLIPLPEELPEQGRALKEDETGEHPRGGARAVTESGVGDQGPLEEPARTDLELEMMEEDADEGLAPEELDDEDATRVDYDLRMSGDEDQGMETADGDASVTDVNPPASRRAERAVRQSESPPPPPAAAPRAAPVASPPPPPQRQAESGGVLRKRQRQPGASAAPSETRRATVRHYHRMNPQRLFPLLVILSKEEIKQIRKKRVSQVSSEEFEVKQEAPIVIEPILPGCDCYPPQQEVPVGEKIEATFWVVPQVLGELKDTRVVIRQESKVLTEVPLRMRVSRQTWTIVLAILTFLLPFASTVMESYGLDFTTQMAQGFPIYARIGYVLFDLLRPEVLGGILLLITLVLYQWNRPKKRDVFWQVEPA